MIKIPLDDIQKFGVVIRETKFLKRKKYSVIDWETGFEIGCQNNEDDADDVMCYLNELFNENEQLKQVIKIIDEMISVEKSNIFRCLYEEDKYEPEIRIDTLEKLKKELKE